MSTMIDRAQTDLTRPPFSPHDKLNLTWPVPFSPDDPITNEAQFEVLNEAWIANQHRGAN